MPVTQLKLDPAACITDTSSRRVSPSKCFHHYRQPPTAIAMSLTVRSPLVRTVVNSIHRLYHPEFADRSWDNTGRISPTTHRPR